jgi:hypothetical protein
MNAERERVCDRTRSDWKDFENRDHATSSGEFPLLQSAEADDRLVRPERPFASTVHRTRQDANRVQTAVPIFLRVYGGWTPRHVDGIGTVIRRLIR